MSVAWNCESPCAGCGRTPQTCICTREEGERVGTASAWLARIALLGGIVFVSWLFWRAV